MIAVALAGAALAADKDDKPQRAAPVQAVVDCRKIEDAAQRLACYDGAVAKMEEAEAKGDLVTVDREQRQAMRRQAFGFNLPTLSLFNRGEKGDDADRITATVAAASQGSNARWTIQLEDGAVWAQTDETPLGRRPRAGSKAEIRRGAMGGYWMNLDGQRAMRVHRVG